MCLIAVVEFVASKPNFSAMKMELAQLLKTVSCSYIDGVSIQRSITFLLKRVIIWAWSLLLENNHSVLWVWKWTLALDLKYVIISLVILNKLAYSGMWALQWAQIQVFWNCVSLCHLRAVAHWTLRKAQTEFGNEKQTLFWLCVVV